MKKIKIKAVEDLLKKIVKQNAISIGFDVAEENTGVCVLRTDKEYIYVEALHKITTNKKDDIKNRMEFFLGALEKFKQLLPKTGQWRIVAIEDCWFGRNVEVLKTLARFSALLWYSFRKECDYIFFILPNSARALIGFNKNTQLEEGTIKPEIKKSGKNKGQPKKVDIKLLVKDYIFQTFKVEIKDHDIADGFVLALAGLLK
jgi:Holliday junction resolvasome RuvABC endonuclease subunit